jgi:hypothetical protein
LSFFDHKLLGPSLFGICYSGMTIGFEIKSSFILKHSD